ncbi:BspA family leucine-rich repeat surface protein [Vagococcus zengguangii]|uniref:BspA family leucine-rich repeat surface protein n=1 Tax=Vagococcus zengguangii TaxID=2571750 RepID=UPI00110982E1|nr:BspA family leucine-rich repeat surface protein [Vagococcus zengguangii]TLG80930.1 BspA family leucine-rich repeat surface protein [Vagococcus zengguangii]
MKANLLSKLVCATLVSSMVTGGVVEVLATEVATIDQENQQELMTTQDTENLTKSLTTGQMIQEQPATDVGIVATGIDGTAPWTLYNDGRFVVESGELAEGVHAWTDHYEKVKSIDFVGKVIFPKNSESMFPLMFNVESINLKNVDTSKVTNMSGMFVNLDNVKNLDLSSFDTSKVTDMSHMFSGLRGLQSLDLSNFDTSNVTNMSSMFYGSENLTNLKISNFNTSNVERLDGMFAYTNLSTLDLSNFDTRKVTNFSNMFYIMKNLKSLNLSSFNTDNAKHMFGMFAYSKNLTDINLSTFNTLNVAEDGMNEFMYESGVKNLTVSDKFKVPTSTNNFFGEEYFKPNFYWIANNTNQVFNTTQEFVDASMKGLSTDTYSLKRHEGDLYYTVSFMTLAEDVVIEPMEIKEGEKLAEPKAPVREGYKFDGWYTDVRYTNKYDFNQPVTNDVTLVLKWTKVDEPKPETKPQGDYISFGKYVTVNNDKGYNTWQNFSWKQKHENSKVANNTYLAKGMYKHQNGSTYYSLYDSKGTWMGYINAKGTKVADGAQGVYQSFGKYVTVNNNAGYNTWQNFAWKQKHANSKVANQTYLAKGQYKHANGSTYYSLYDSKGTWMGYINVKGTKLADGAQGVYQSFGKYVTVNNNAGYNTWQNFAWKQKHANSKVANQTYLAKGQYKHGNGSTYYSLYDSKGTWMGYINAKGTKLADGAQGVYQAYGKKVTVKNDKGYNTWQNFSWKKKYDNSKLANKTYTAKGLYKHANGSTYYSLYDVKGTWMGYINAKGTK